MKGGSCCMAKKRAKEKKLGTVATIQSYLMISGSVAGLIVFVVIPLI